MKNMVAIGHVFAPSQHASQCTLPEKPTEITTLQLQLVTL